MSQPMHISEIMHLLVLNNPKESLVQILRHCPFIQIEMLKKGYMTFDELTDEEINRLKALDLEDFDIEELKRKEAEL